MSTGDGIDVHPATSSEFPRVVVALSRAFFEDRIWRWLVPDDAQRRDSTRAFYSAFAKACWRHGAVYMAGSGVGARCGYRRATRRGGDVGGEAGGLAGGGSARS